MKIPGMNSRLWMLVPALSVFVVLMAAGCNTTKTDAGTPGGTMPAPVASSASVTTSTAPVPGNPNPNAAANAAAFEAARKKAEGK